MGDTPGDWTYHGIDGLVSGDDEARILVEAVEWGPTEREDVTVLRELVPQQGEGGFLWGYTGGGPTRAAAAILADALDLPGPRPGELYGTRWQDDRTWIRLRNDFCVDALSQMCPEWRLRRDVILRWVRGWYSEQGLTNVPPAAIDLPVIEPRRNKRPPTGPEGAAP